MKRDRLKNEDGEFCGFAVDNTQVSRSGMAQIAAQILGVLISKPPRFFDDVAFCEFSFNGHRVVIEEPYGDSSTYDVIAPESGLVEMEAVAAHFESATPINGGDAGYAVFSLINMAVGGIIFILVLTGIAAYFS